MSVNYRLPLIGTGYQSGAYWSANGAGTLHDCVKEYPTCDGDATFINIGSGTHLVAFTVDPSGLPDTTINSLIIAVVCVNASSGAKIKQYVRYPNGSGNLSAQVSVTNSGYDPVENATYAHTWSVNPNTGSAWTKQNLADYMFGIEMYHSGSNKPGFHTSQLIVSVNMENPPAPAPGASKGASILL